MTFDELHYLALQCRDEMAAEALLRVCKDHRWELPFHGGVTVDTQTAIGYIGGYQDRKEQARLWKLFETEHFQFAPNERLSAGQLFMLGHRIASRIDSPEHREQVQSFLDAHDYSSLRAWLRTPMPGEPPWPESEEGQP